MAEDYSIQQKQSSSTPYFVAGAAIGGLGTGIGASHFTKPKYGTYDEIIAETSDKDKFDKKIEGAPEDDKKFLQDAKELGDKKAAVEAEYDKEFEEYKKANGTAKVETDEYKKLVEEEKNAEKALNDKKNELINKEVERLKAAGASDKSSTIEKALNNKSKQIANATKSYEQLKASGASAEDIKKAADKVAELQKEAEELSKKIAEKFDYKGLTGEALEAKKNEVANAYKLAIQDRVNQKLKSFDTPLESADAKLLREFKESRTAITEQKAALDKTMDELGEVIGKDIKGIYNSAHGGMVNSKVSTAVSAEMNHIKKLEVLKEAFNKVSSGTASTGEFTWEKFFEGLKKLGTGEAISGEAKNIQAELTKYLKDTEGLTDKEITAVKKLINGEVNAENIQAAINNATARKTKIEGLVNKAIAAEQNIEKLSEESAAIRERMNARNVYVKDGELIDKKTGKPVKPTPAPHETPTKVNLPKDVTEPKDARIEYTSKSAANMSEEELRKQAEAAVKADAYKAEADALNKAKAAREAAYGKLEDGAKIADDEVQKAFNKAKGYESRDKFISDKFDAAKKDFMEKYAEKLKRKWGFAEHTNLKIATATLVGATVLGGIFSLFAPKKN